MTFQKSGSRDVCRVWRRRYLFDPGRNLRGVHCIGHLPDLDRLPFGLLAPIQRVEAPGFSEEGRTSL